MISLYLPAKEYSLENSDTLNFLTTSSYKNYSYDSFQEGFNEFLDSLEELSKNHSRTFGFRTNFFENQSPFNASKPQLSHSPNFQIYELFPENISGNEFTFKEHNHFPLKEFIPLVSREDFLTMAQNAITDINQGAYYQVNLSIPFRGAFDLNDKSIFSLYGYLKEQFQAKYSACLPIPIPNSHQQAYLFSFSPELFFYKKDQRIITCPIKGTKAKNFEKELLQSVKEERELSMIVDLLRNDLHKISVGSALVEKHRAVMELKHLGHTYSKISAYTQKSLSEILQAFLPGGSITGCPKSESLKAIQNYEHFERDYYTGAIGVIHNGEILSSLAIRTLYVFPNGEFIYHAGAGLVALSRPEEEYEEILLKAKNLSELFNKSQ